MITRPAPKPKAKRVRVKPRWDQTGFVAPKHQRIRDPDHLADVRKLPCCTCMALGEKQRTRTEPHHVIPRRRCGGDDTVAPQCIRHHKLADLLLPKAYKQRTGVDLMAIAKSLWALRRKYGSCL